MRKQVWVSTGGCFAVPSFLATLDAFGADRLLYAVDHPFGSLEQGRAVLEQLAVDASTLAKNSSGNADNLFKLSTGQR